MVVQCKPNWPFHRLVACFYTLDVGQGKPSGLVDIILSIYKP